MRYVIAAESHGSFRKAAFALNVKQSTLSRTIAQIEGRLGIALFERSSGGVHLTTAGLQIVRTFRHLVESIDHIAANAREIGLGRVGQLTIGHYTSLAAGNLRASLIEFAGRYSDVEVRTVESSRSNLLAELAGGFIDIAIVTGDPVPGMDNTMALWTERIMVALPESLPLAQSNIVHWTDLKEETFLISERDPGPEILNVLHSKLAFDGGLPKIARHNASRENIRSLVGAGFGISLMVEAGIGAKYPGVVYRELRDGNGLSRISFSGYWKSDNPNPALTNFIALLKERHPSPRGYG
ncbi:LysR family transcriptional regulator [Roseibium album]|uniref:LysR family transcriptional regulator n=1 Tax=Roseibium album TaxID=311410 RepID=UPI0024932D69|nr:LysR family transcriptional regulator [Roseibium album]